MEKYTYRPLQPGEIRLFKLEPAARAGCAISGTLISVPISACESGGLQDERMNFTALSYAWGPTYNDGSHLLDYIICDGCRLRVTPNLKQALLRIREIEFRFIRRNVRKTRKTYEEEREDFSELRSFSPTMGRLHKGLSLHILWIDALCINQMDLEERSHQVQIMASIFAASCDLLVWLGEPAKGSLGVDQQILIGSYKVSWYGSPLRKCLLSSAREKAVLQSLLARAWFSRRWVIQEVEKAMSMRTHLVLGCAMCPRSFFEGRLLSHHLLDNAIPLSRTDVFDYMYQNAIPKMYRYDRSECADPRDYVYAIKDLSHSSADMKVDYYLDVRTTYLTFVKKVVLDALRPEWTQVFEEPELTPIRHSHPIGGACRLYGMVAMLAISSCKQRSEEAREFESWIPDWRVLNTFTSSDHEQAVNAVMRAPPLPWETSTWELEIDSTGRHCLHLTGTVLLPSKHAKLIGMLAHLKKQPEYQATDCILFARLDIERTREQLEMGELREFKVIAFMLRVKFGIPSFSNKPAYTVHSCFLLDWPEHETKAGLFAMDGVVYPEQRDLAASYGLKAAHEFYLV